MVSLRRLNPVSGKPTARHWPALSVFLLNHCYCAVFWFVLFPPRFGSFCSSCCLALSASPAVKAYIMPTQYHHIDLFPAHLKLHLPKGLPFSYMNEKSLWRDTAPQVHHYWWPQAALQFSSSQLLHSEDRARLRGFFVTGS